MNDLVKSFKEINDYASHIRDVLSVCAKETEELKEQQFRLQLRDVQGVREETGWSLKTAQKAMRDPRMHTIWLGKGPQVTLKELERYCSLNIDRSTDDYWTNQLI